MSQDSVISISGLNRGQEDSASEASAGQGAGPWEESLGGLPQRPLFHRVSYPPRISLNSILISLLCTMLLVFIGFVLVSLPTPLDFGNLNTPGAHISYIQYTFQIPLALMIAAFLGPFLGTASLLLFLALGLGFYPVFANGGGWHYLTEPGFGYLAATLVVGHLVGKTFHKAFQKENNFSRSLKILMMSVVSVLLIHVAGMLYMGGLAVAGQLPWQELPGWMLRLTVETAPYDIVAAFMFLCLVRQLRLGLWLVLY